MLLCRCASLFLLFFLCTLTLSEKPSRTKFRREIIKAYHGAVATDDGRCSRIGRNVLHRGGHAVDASVASALCLGVVNSACSGIGGGAFMIVRSADGEAEAYDMRETAPIHAFKDMYGGNTTLKSIGALSIGVPGEVAGLHKAWKKYGKLPWKRLVEPAEHLARNGFKISPYLRMQMEKTETGILADKGLRDIFTYNGTLKKPGDTCYNQKLANTLKLIGEFGPTAFYNGPIGHNLVRDVKKIGGILTVDDLKNYLVKVKKPITSNIMGLNLLGMPPPSSGGPAMVLILNILSQYKSHPRTSTSVKIHRVIESLKHAFAMRMNLGDPDFVDVKKVVADMLSPEFAKELKKSIFDNRTFSPPHYGGKWNQINEHGTTHLSIIDKERNAVSLTSTINSYFGSQYLSPSTGIVLNNEMDDFSIPMNVSAGIPPPAPPNFVFPGKRPLSSMSPTIVVKDKKLKAVIGASGGAKIIASTTEVFFNHFFRGLSPLASVMAPRFYHQLIPNVVLYENWTTVAGDHIEVPRKIRTALERRGHVLQGLNGGTICQFIVQDLKNNSNVGKLLAVSDPRKGGFPSGF